MPRFSMIAVLLALNACGAHRTRPATSPYVRGALPFTVDLPAACEHRSSGAVDSRPGEWSCSAFLAHYDWGARHLVGVTAAAPPGVVTDSVWTEVIDGRQVALIRYSAPVDVLGLVAVWADAGEQRVAGASYPAALQIRAEAIGSGGLDGAFRLVRSVRWVVNP